MHLGPAPLPSQAASCLIYLCQHQHQHSILVPHIANIINHRQTSELSKRSLFPICLYYPRACRRLIIDVHPQSWRFQPCIPLLGESVTPLIRRGSCTCRRMKLCCPMGSRNHMNPVAGYKQSRTHASAKEGTWTRRRLVCRKARVT